MVPFDIGYFKFIKPRWEVASSPTSEKIVKIKFKLMKTYKYFVGQYQPLQKDIECDRRLQEMSILDLHHRIHL